MAESCAEVGYRATSVSGVIERAGIDRERFDSLFIGKEDCALAAFNRFVSETVARVAIEAPGGGTRVDRGGGYVRPIIELAGALPAFAQLACIESRHGGTARMRAAYGSAAGVMALMMERLGRAQEVPDATVRARAALGSLEALARREIAGGRTAQMPRLLPDFVYAALVPFVGQREALRQSKLAARGLRDDGPVT